MSKKAIICFSLWTSCFSALFYFVYGFLPFGIGWMMFVCLGGIFWNGLISGRYTGVIVVLLLRNFMEIV